jgi:hypothetical protein
VLIDRTHLGWGLASAAAFGAATIGYAASVAGPREGSGGSVVGLVFGILALAAMIFAGLLAVRKKFPGLRLGSAQFWLRGHIWLGLLSVPFAFYHASFRFGGALETAFMLVFLAVIASGVYGLALQQVLPRMLKVRVPLETFPQQIPYLLEKMKEEGQQLIKDLEGAPKKAAPAAAAGAGDVAAAAAGAAAKPAALVASAALVGASGDAAAKIAAAKAAAAAKIAAAKAAAAKASAAKVATADAPTSAPSEAPSTVAVAAPAETAPPTSNAEAPAAAPTEKRKPAALDVAAKLAAARAAANKATSGADSTKPVMAKSVAAAKKPDPAAIAAAAKASALAAAAKASAAAKAASAADAPAAPAAAAPRGPAAPIAAAPADGPMPRLELLTRFFQDKVIPFLTSDPRAAARENLASENYARMAFANLAVALPARAHGAIERLEEIVAERRQFLVQVRIQSWLRAWLLVHVPLSAALFVLAAVHVVVALRVVPFF